MIEVGTANQYSNIGERNFKIYMKFLDNILFFSGSRHNIAIPNYNITWEENGHILSC